MLQLAPHDAPDDIDVLGAHLCELNHTLREQLLATPYLVYMLSNHEGRDLITILNLLEKKAFRVRALSRQRARHQDVDTHITDLLTLISQTSDRLDLEHCPTLQELFDTMFLAITCRHRHLLDQFIETLLDLRATWSHAVSVVSRSPI